MRARALVFAVLVACCLVGCGGSASGFTPRKRSSASYSDSVSAGTRGLERVSIMSGGHLRSYLLYVPPGDSTKHRLPLVLVYHGADDTAAEQPSTTNLLNLAERRHNMIVVFLQGYDNTWNEGAGNTPAHQARINDVAFTSAVLRRIESTYQVDLRRVVAAGFSNGALLTELLGCRIAQNLTLIMPVSGPLPVSVSSGCHPSRPLSVYEIHGTADGEIPYGGGRFYGVGGGTTVLSAQDSAARWAALDHCSATGRQSHSGDSEFVTSSGCRDGVTVTLDSIQGGGHAWPDDFGQTVIAAVDALPSKRAAVKP